MSKKRETFLQMHDRLLRHGVYYSVSNLWKFQPKFLPCGLCVVDFNGRDLLEDATFKYFFGRRLGKLSNNGLAPQGEYSDLRQNIILLCAAINNEL